MKSAPLLTFNSYFIFFMLLISIPFVMIVVIRAYLEKRSGATTVVIVYPRVLNRVVIRQVNGVLISFTSKFYYLLSLINC